MNKKNRNTKNKKGFSYLQLMAVLIFVGILSTISFNYYSNYRIDAELSANQSQAKSMQELVIEYEDMNNGELPLVNKNADYISKPALIELSLLASDLSKNISGNYYIYGMSKTVYYDYPPEFIKDMFNKYLADKGVKPFFTGSNYVDVKLLYNNGYLEFKPLTSYIITTDGIIEQVPLSEDTGFKLNELTFLGKDKPSTPIIIPNIDGPYYANDTIFFSAHSVYEGGKVTYEWQNVIESGKYPQGTRTIKVTAIGEDGLHSDTSTFNLVIDGENLAPTKPIITLPPPKNTILNKYTSDEVININANSTDPNGDAISYKWLGKSLSGVYPRGKNTVSVYAVDNKGNQSEKSSAIFEVFNSPPKFDKVKHLVGGNEIPQSQTIYSYTKIIFEPVIADRDGDLIEVKRLTPTPPTDTYSVGNHSIEYEAWDSYKEKTTYIHNFTITNTAPIKPIINYTPSSGLYSDTYVTFTASGSSDIDSHSFTYEWRKNGGAWSITPPNGKFAVGSHLIEARAVDQLGLSSAIASLNFEINNTPPTKPTLTATPSTGIKSTDTVALLASGSTDVDGDAITYLYSADGGDWTTTPPTKVYSGGNHQVLAKARDSRGVESEVASVSFYVNNVPTKPSISYTPSTGLRANTFINFSRTTSTDADGHAIVYEWKRDSQAWTTTEPDGTYTMGTHTIYLRVRDSMGEYSATDSVSFTIVNTAPSVPTITMNDTTPDATQTITYTASGSTDIDGDTITYYWKLDAGSWTTTAPNGRLGSGSHTIYLKAVDPFGAESTIASITFTVSTKQLTLTVSFPQSTDQTPSKVATIPYSPYVINSVTVNTGTVTYSISGQNVTVNPANGTYVYRESFWNSTMYSKTGTGSRTSTTNTFTTTIAYNDGTYTGNIGKSGASWVISGTAAASKTGTAYRTSSTNSFASTYPYDDGTYDGDIGKNGASYVSSGSYTAASTVNDTGTRTSNSCPSMSGYSTTKCTTFVYHKVVSGDTYWELADYYYGSGTQWGKIEDENGQAIYALKIGSYLRIPTPTTRSSGTWYYEATYYKAATDTRIYRQDYSGTVYKPDTRNWQQNYSGTVYAGGTDYRNYQYAYTATITYTVK